jgi:RNA polymerase sigma-70 factor, ECF subfamily
VGPSFPSEPIRRLTPDFGTRAADRPDPDVTTRSTEELLNAVAQGDERAFELLYDRLAAPVTSMVHAVVRDHSQAEEVVQEVFFQLWLTASRYRQDRGGAQSWAMTVAHRRAVDRVRSAQARTDRERAAQIKSYSGSPFDTVVEQVLDNCERGQVRACLRRLTALEREAIVLAYYQALSYRQVAERLGVATGTVKGRMRAGLQRIRDSLGLDPVIAPGEGRTAVAK